jgi:hypothetical protein
MRTVTTLLTVGGVAVLAALAYAAWRGAGGTGQQIGGAVVDLADGVIGGAVTGAGQIIGIPATNMTECERAKAEGRTWDASFACPAADFIRYAWS